MLKFGWMTEQDDGISSTTIPTTPYMMPNLTARLLHQFTTLVGDEMNRVQNPNSLYQRTRSMERGLITNMENQTRVWKRMLDVLGVTGVPLHTNTAECLGWKVQRTTKKAKTAAATSAAASTVAATATIPVQTIAVILLLPPYCPRVVLDQILHVWIEDLGVAYVGLGVSATCASWDQTFQSSWKTSCTVDLGWSSSLVVPAFHNKPIHQAATVGTAGGDDKGVVRRLPIGGRHMINMLKYYMSYRQYNLMDQESLMRDVFERLSFVSLDMRDELNVAKLQPSGRRRYDRDFVLPDYQRTFQGEIRLPVALQKDLEREAKRKEQQEQNGGAANGAKEDEDDDDDEEEDEDFEVGDDESDEEDDDNDVEMDDGDDKPKKSTQSKKGKKRKHHDDEEDEEDEEEEESMKAKRKRLLEQRAEEERRRRLQQEEEQVLRVSVERFAIPEVLFRPLDAGLQADLVGLAQTIVQSVQACPEAYRPALYRTIYLVGGIARLPNLKERLEKELRPLIPSEYEMNISLADSPVDRAWHGANAIFKQIPYTEWAVSRREWEDASRRKAYQKLLIENGGHYL